MKTPSLFETICDIVRKHDAMERDNRPIESVLQEQADMLTGKLPCDPALGADCHDDGFYNNKRDK